MAASKEIKYSDQSNSSNLYLACTDLHCMQTTSGRKIHGGGTV
jgi:hypothetical protein